MQDFLDHSLSKNTTTTGTSGRGTESTVCPPLLGVAAVWGTGALLSKEKVQQQEWLQQTTAEDSKILHF